MDRKYYISNCSSSGLPPTRTPYIFGTWTTKQWARRSLMKRQWWSMMCAKSTTWGVFVSVTLNKMAESRSSCTRTANPLPGMIWGVPGVTRSIITFPARWSSPQGITIWWRFFRYKIKPIPSTWKNNSKAIPPSSLVSPISGTPISSCQAMTLVKSESGNSILWNASK